MQLKLQHIEVFAFNYFISKKLISGILEIFRLIYKFIPKQNVIKELCLKSIFQTKVVNIAKLLLFYFKFLFLWSQKAKCSNLRWDFYISKINLKHFLSKKFLLPGVQLWPKALLTKERKKRIKTDFDIWKVNFYYVMPFLK